MTNGESKQEALRMPWSLVWGTGWIATPSLQLVRGRGGGG